MSDDPLAPLAAVRPVFRAVARTVVPEADTLDEDGWREVEGIVGDALRDRPTSLVRQLRLLLEVIRWLPLLRWGRTFPHLSAHARRRVLAGFQDAPLLPLRRGFWGLRTLCLMGYYGRGTAAEEIGYAARLRGRRDRDAAIRGEGRGRVLERTPRRDP